MMETPRRPRQSPRSHLPARVFVRTSCPVPIRASRAHSNSYALARLEGGCPVDPKLRGVFHSVEGQTALIAERIASVDEPPVPRWVRRSGGRRLDPCRPPQPAVGPLPRGACRRAERDAGGAVPGEPHVGQSRKRTHRGRTGARPRAPRQDGLRAGTGLPAGNYTVLAALCVAMALGVVIVFDRHDLTR